MGQKYVIGLTGNIATGKTLVLRMLKELGAYTIDADDLVHILMRRGNRLYDKVVAEFGHYILDEQKEIDRGKLGGIVFADAKAMAHLESITHPTVKQVVAQLTAKSRADVVVVEAIKIIESGMADDYDALWVVVASQDVQLSRLVQKRHMRPDEAWRRIKAQSSQEEKAALADVVINNSGDVLQTWKAVQRHYAAIPARPPAAQKPPLAIEGEQRAKPLSEQVKVRRASRGDLPVLFKMMPGPEADGQAPDESLLMERFFSKGYFVAEANDRLLGAGALFTENLVAIIDDLSVVSDELWPRVGQALLDALEKEIRELSCEVGLLFLAPPVQAQETALLKKNGYQQKAAKELVKIWRQAAEEYRDSANSVMMVKQFLDRPIMRPM